MTRFINALLVFLMVLSAAAVYDMKYEAEVAEATIAGLEQEIAREQAEVSLLKAEWSVLTQPARLQDLVDRYQDILQLQPLTSSQIGSVAEIPAKPEIEPGIEPGIGPEIIGPEVAIPPVTDEQRSAQVDAAALVR